MTIKELNQYKKASILKTLGKTLKYYIKPKYNFGVSLYLSYV